MRGKRRPLGALLATLAAGGPVHAAEPDLAALFARATTEEQAAGAAVAIDSALELMDRALAGADSRQGEAALLAALDLLVGRAVGPLTTLRSPTALAYRHPGAFERVRARLDTAYAGAARLSPFAPAAIARAGYELALHAGDATAAGTWRQRAGCVPEATVVGPLAWPPITAQGRPTSLERPGARLLAAYPGVPPFGGRVVPTVVRAGGCTIELQTTSSLEGLRAVVVDVELARRQRLALELETRSAATVVVGGQPVLVRPHALGGGEVRVRGMAQAGPGRVRIVARVGWKGEGSQITLQVLGEDGAPVPTAAPRPGQAAPGRAVPAKTPALLPDAPRGDPERWLLAAAHLALGDARTAEHLIEVGTNQPGKTVIAPQAPLPALLYARALPVAGDLPENRVTQLLQAAHAATLRAWPRAWEALAGQALLAVRHHGPVEGEIQALAAIARARASLASLDPALLALQANLAARSELRDLAAATFAELTGALAGTPLLAHLDRVVGSRVGAEQEAFLCGAPGLARYSTDCMNSRVARGDQAGALGEIQRLRALWPAPDSMLRAEIVQRLALGEIPAAVALYDRTLPAYRPVGLLAGLFADDPRDLRARLARDVPTTSEDPAGALAAFTSLLGESPAPVWEAESPGRVAADRRHSAATGAATLVLAHRESYALEASGLLRYTLYDLRRVSGTADVDRPDEVAPQGIWGRELRRSLRRRIFKPDGRVLDPEPRVGQRQGRTDLSQLEPGDYLEEITEGFSLPASTGQIFVMTQHLLPARTSVQEATVEIRRPAGLSLPLWAHPLLGRPVTSRRGGEIVTRYSLAGAAPRRLETNVPTGDQSVAVYLATTPWQASGAMLAETIAALDDDDPRVSGWARTLEPPAGSSDRDRIAAVVTAVGQIIKRADPTTLVDTDWASPRTQRSTARTILELGDGSRSWLAYRALRELGLAVEILVAEEEPLSADPRYPHRFGRFRHPLLVVDLRTLRGFRTSREGLGQASSPLAHALQGRGEKTPIWLDLDVRGPPLPPGRISPQLRGRLAVDTAGKIRPLPGTVAGDQPTRLSLDLKLDDQGTARGTFTAALGGREAQLMADELPYLVGQRRDQRLRAVVLGWLPSATVNDVALVSQEGAPEVSLKAGVELPGYGQADGTTWSLPGIEPLHNIYTQPPVATLGSTFAKHRARDSALAIDDAISYRLDRRVELPAAGRLQGGQPSLALRDPHIAAARRIDMNARAAVVEERFELEIPTAALDRRRYRRFVAAAARIDEAFQAPTRVILAPASR